MREINISKTINKGKLVLKEPIIYSLFPVLVYGSAIAFMLLSVLVDLVTKRAYNPAQNGLILVLLISSLIAYVMIRNSINSFTCQVFYGNNKEDNKRLAQLVLSEYEKIKITKNNEQLIYAHLDRHLLYDWGNELYLIFDNDRVLVNFSSLGLFDVPQPFRFYGDRKFEKELVDKFALLSSDDKMRLEIDAGAKGKAILFKISGLIAWILVIIGFISLIIKLFVR